MSLHDHQPGADAPATAPPPIVPLAAPAPGVALWWFVLDVTEAQLRNREHFLSHAEHARAARYGQSILRNRYVVGRGSLRLVLGRVLGVPAADVPIVRGRRGRPQLAGETALDFNISHTGAVALLGLSSGVRLGVDVERLDRNINVAGIARKFLTANERNAIAALAADAARRRVITLWTCKEAMSKATGDALSAPFSSLDVDVDTGLALRSGPAAYRPERWSLHAAAVPAGYVATVAVWRLP